MGGYPEAYADGMADVDTYGPNAALTFFRVQRVGAFAKSWRRV